MRTLGDAVLLERAVDGVTRQQCLRAERLVGLLAEIASQAGAIDPLHPDVVTADLR